MHIDGKKNKWTDEKHFDKNDQLRPIFILH